MQRGPGHRKRVVLGVAGAALLAVAAVTAVAVVRPVHPARTVRPVNNAGPGGESGAGAVVLRAADRLAAAGSAAVTVQFSAQVGGESETATGSGGVDFASQAMKIDMNVSGGMGATEIPALYIGGTLYEALPRLDQIEPGKTWVSDTLATTAEAEGAPPSALGVGGNPSLLAILFAQPGANVVPAGTTSVDGVATSGYFVSFSQAALLRLRNDTRLPQAERATLSQDVTGLSGDLDIDSSGRIVEDSMTMTIAGSVPVQLTESVDFSRYGTPVSVSAPPSGSVVSLQQVLKDERSRQVQVA